MLRVQDMADYESLPATGGIKQPRAGDNREEVLTTDYGLDLILVPGVAFTASGKRCGRGMGRYDAYLARVKKSNASCKIFGLAYKEQIEDDIPTGPTDVMMGKVLYEGAKVD
jgi:5-formyltetrahydrofolate cyclo-ligase